MRRFIIGLNIRKRRRLRIGLRIGRGEGLE